MPANNVNPDEIAKFDALAQQWWDKDGPMQPLHQINPLRLQFIQQYCTLANQDILDVGCGAGLLSEALAAQEAIVTGIDLSEQAITVAKQHAAVSELSINYQISDVATLTRQEQQYAIITCMEMLEHVPEPDNIIKSCSELLKPGGYLFLSTLNRNLKSYLMSIIGAEYVLRMLPIGTHDYQQFIKPSELERMCRHAQLQRVSIQGLTYKPLQQSFQLSDDVSVNYIACYQKAPL